MNLETKDGILIAEGEIFHTEHALAYHAIIPSRGTGQGKIIIQVRADVLAPVEEKRGGGDLELNIRSRVLVSRVYKISKFIFLGDPWQSQFDYRHSGSVSYRIPQSEWVKHLRSLAWSELELIEIPSASIKAKPTLARAIERLRDAQDCYWRGLWEESMLNCRKAFEALVKDSSGEDSLENGQKAIRNLIPDKRKADRIDILIKELAPFLHFGRHEKLPIIPIGPIDAQVALRMSGALLAYIASN